MKKLKKVYVEITNKCNLSCDFCPEHGRREKFMDRQLFDKILHEVGEFTGQLYFHVLGEPLLHPELGSFLDMCHERDLKVNITTNGSLIDLKAAVLLSSPALRQVNFSLHSFEANYRAYPVDKYLDRIFEFIERSRSCEKLLIGLRLWNINGGSSGSLNRYILDRIAGMALQWKGERSHILPYYIPEEVTPVNGLKLYDNVFLHIAEVFDWPDPDIEDICGKGFCYGLRDQAAILADGTVVPCCLDGKGVINLGNIQNESFADIIGGERARKLYEGFSRREAVESLCRKCGYRMRFG